MHDNLTYITVVQHIVVMLHEFFDNGIGSTINTLKKWDTYNDSLIVVTHCRSWRSTWGSLFMPFEREYDTCTCTCIIK